MEGRGRESTVFFERLASVFEEINARTGRIEIIGILARYYEALRREDAASLVMAVYLSIGRVSSESGGLELNVGEGLILKAISSISGEKAPILKDKVKREGDVSKILSIRSFQKLSFAGARGLLTIRDVYGMLEEITRTMGKSSAERKVGMIVKLISKARDDLEVKYILRLLEGRLKIGLSIQTVIMALATSLGGGGPSSQAREGSVDENENENEDEDEGEDGSVKMERSGEGGGENAEAVSILKDVYSQVPSFSKIIPIALEHGIYRLRENCSIEPGYPLRPMLAIAEKDVASVAKRYKDARISCEYKYDGERIQVHRKGGEIRMFSRGLEETTYKFEYLKKVVERSARDKEDFVLDGEVVAYDRDAERILPFQVLSSRKRKAGGDGQEEQREDICLFAFDLLYYGKPLIRLSLEKRRESLKAHFAEQGGEFQYSVSSEPGKETREEDIEAFFNASVEHGCEGIIVKEMGEGAVYEPSKRSLKWVKLKSDYVTGFFETFDLIVLGGYRGKGKRSGGYGGFLLGCLDKEGEVRTVCKLGTGFSDYNLKRLGEKLEEFVADVPVADSSLSPDVWFAPRMLWEVQCAGVSLSPNYSAGMGSLDEGKGLSLRFPRFVREREDKRVEDCTSNERILALYLKSRDAADLQKRDVEEETYY